MGGRGLGRNIVIARRAGGTETAAGLGPKDSSRGVAARGGHSEERLSDAHIGGDGRGIEFAAKVLAQSFGIDIEGEGDVRVPGAHAAHNGDDAAQLIGRLKRPAGTLFAGWPSGEIGDRNGEIRDIRGSEE